MSQCFLTRYNGFLSLQKPRVNPLTGNSSADYEWARTELDNICVEGLLEESAIPSRQGRALTPRKRHRAWRQSCPYTAQYQLSSKDGVLILRKPQYHFHPRLRLRGCKDTTAADSYTTCHSTPRTSILLLPPELRLEIYRHLLVSNEGILYPIHDGLRIVARPAYYATHTLYPEILATCRLINREAAQVLYGENLFRREFNWPHKFHAPHQQCPWPIAGMYRLRAQNIQFISRIQIVRQYHRWLLGDGELKIFQDFPSLAELQVHIDLNDPSKGLDLNVVWQNTMKAASRKQPKLKHVECWIRLAYDHDYHAWCDSGTSRSLDFSLHTFKKTQFEQLMAHEKLFVGRRFSWSFETITSQYAGPCCSVTFAIDDGNRTDRHVGIWCHTLGDDGAHSSMILS